VLERRLWLVWGWSLSGLRVVLQSSLLDGVAFDPFSLQEDGPVSAEVDVGGRQVLEAFVIAPVIVVLDEARDLGFEIARQVIVINGHSKDTILRCDSSFALTGTGFDRRVPGPNLG
jgi:hypothetical protein